MRKRSPAKSAASSPPTPPRISTMTFFASFGSLGRSRIGSSRSNDSSRGRSSAISSSARRRMSASGLSSKIAFASRSPSRTFLYSRYFSTIGTSCACSRLSFCHFGMSASTAGSLISDSSSRYFSSTAWSLSSTSHLPHFPSPAAKAAAGVSYTAVSESAALR